MNKTTPSSAREQFIGPLLLVVVGLVIVGVIGYFGRSARHTPTTAASPPESAPTTPPEAPTQTTLPARYRATEAPPDVVVAFDALYSRGNKKAPVVLVEFSDYQCPFCARHVRETVPQIEKEYVQTGKLRYAFRNFPLERLHPQAFKAAEASLCAAEQGKFWEMHDQLFAHQQALGVEDLHRHAQTLRLNVTRFRQCLESGRYADKVRHDLSDGQKVGIRGTPYFVIGYPDGTDRVKAAKIISGAYPFQSFKEAIDSLLSRRPQ